MPAAAFRLGNGIPECQRCHSVSGMGFLRASGAIPSREWLSRLGRDPVFIWTVAYNPKEIILLRIQDTLARQGIDQIAVLQAGTGVIPNDDIVFSPDFDEVDPRDEPVVSAYPSRGDRVHHLHQPSGRLYLVVLDDDLLSARDGIALGVVACVGDDRQDENETWRDRFPKRIRLSHKLMNYGFVPLR